MIESVDTEAGIAVNFDTEFDAVVEVNMLLVVVVDVLVIAVTGIAMVCGVNLVVVVDIPPVVILVAAVGIAWAV